MAFDATARPQPARRINANWKRRSVTFWYGTGFYSLKACRSWDGRFALSGKTLTPFGWRRDARTADIPDEPGITRTRTSVGWRAWMPYLMAWHLDNVRDDVSVEVPDGDPRIGTTTMTGEP